MSSTSVPLNPFPEGEGGEPPLAAKATSSRDHSGPLLQLSQLVCAYNEEENIGNLIEASLRQTGANFIFKELCVVASGCTDQTVEIVRRYSALDPRVKLLVQPERTGKASAVKVGLEALSGDVVLLENADTIPAPESFQKIVEPFENHRTKLVCVRPVPVMLARGFTGFLVDTLWKIHHVGSRITPKAGEAFAFRSTRMAMPADIEDDDTFLGVTLASLQGSSVYAESAIVFNRVPMNLRDFLTQRFRINRQILGLKKRTGIVTSTWTPEFARAVVRYVLETPRALFAVALLGMFEALVRGGALFALLVRRSKLVTWAPIPSTKSPFLLVSPSKNPSRARR
jgi:biofilm PGA synthesis N-glycosyltransferase PgaC